MRKGMTLMELIVAIAITGMMAAAGTATFSSIIDHRRVIKTATLQTERASALREMIRGWIAAGTIQIQSGGAPRGSGSSVRVSQRPGMLSGVTAAATTGDELTINTTALTPTVAASTRIRLFVDADENTPEHGLAMEYQASNASPLQRKQLDSTVGAMAVEFLDDRTGRWYPETEAATIRPIAVRFTFTAVEGDSLAPLLTLPFVYRIGDVQQQRGRR
jgi:prepilin-type N-terminal cleavage/methylation domain-containing protein